MCAVHGGEFEVKKQKMLFFVEFFQNFEPSVRNLTVISNIMFVISKTFR